MVKEAVLYREFETVFEDRQAAVLAKTITEAYTDLVKTSDFNELKEIVRHLAQAQDRTEVRMEELAQAQERTEAAVQKTEAAVQKLVLGLTETRREVGELSRSMSYALENEAYRCLPAFLNEQHGIEMTERLVRTDIGEEEINFFGHAMRNDEPVIIVGETKLRLDERRRAGREEDYILDQLERKLDAVRDAYPEAALVPLLVTHYARTAFARQAEGRGILLVQSFEW